METNDKDYKKHGMHEGNPGSINRNEIDNANPDKDNNYKAENPTNGFGKTPADEHIDDSFSQIDSSSMQQTIAKEFDTSDFKRVDERDNDDSTEEWDAEKSRTGRHK